MNYKPGQLVVYRKYKHTTHPSPRAIRVRPSEHGEDYDYAIDKYWVIFEVSRNCIYCKTRSGKIVTISIDDPNLMKANFITRYFKRYRFPA